MLTKAHSSLYDRAAVKQGLDTGRRQGYASALAGLWSGLGGTLTSLEAIAEFKVLTSNYGAQYGRNGSGTVEVETKSGTNAFHGNVYSFVRNDIFNAKNYFQSSVPAYKKNDFGYTIGGPVYIPGVYNRGKDKTFFFWSEEDINQ